MTENQIKESISKNYIRTIANRQGFKVEESSLDHGVDLRLIEVAKRSNPDGSTRFLDSGRQVELQLKCTTEKYISYSEDKIKYILEVKTYNDLIQRRKASFPLILILFILPDDEHNWVVCDQTMLKISKHAYWFLPDADDVESKNKDNITIDIESTNIVSKDTVKELFDLTYS